jgi:hypothetical protein
MAKNKAAGNRHKEIEQSTDDPFERAARVQEETSNDGKFSTYERVSTPNPEDADLILQWRGAPEEGK